MPASDQPWVYACSKGEAGIHHWNRRQNGTARCRSCGTILTKQQANECFGRRDKEST